VYLLAREYNAKPRPHVYQSGNPKVKRWLCRLHESKHAASFCLGFGIIVQRHPGIWLVCGRSQAVSLQRLRLRLVQDRLIHRLILHLIPFSFPNTKPHLDLKKICTACLKIWLHGKCFFVLVWLFVLGAVIIVYILIWLKLETPPNHSGTSPRLLS